MLGLEDGRAVQASARPISAAGRRRARGWQDLLPGPDKTGRKHNRGSSQPKSATRSEVPRFIVLDLDHHETLRRNGRAGFRAVTEFVQTITVPRHEFPPPHTYHLPPHSA